MYTILSVVMSFSQMYSYTTIKMENTPSPEKSTCGANLHQIHP